MKKPLQLLLFTSFLIFIGCSKKKDPTPAACSNTINTEYSAALNAWLAEPNNKIKCQAVVNILGNLVNCPGVTAVAKAEYQQLLNDNPCSGL